MSTTTLKKGARTNISIWMVILVIFVVLGIAAWIFQLTQGLSSTGINQAVVWGIYIGTFFLLAGTASGFLFLASLGNLVFIPGLDKYRPGLLIGAVCTYIAAGIIILMDIGHPERVYQFLTSPQFNSPFVWDFYALALGTIAALAFLFLNPKEKWMGWIAGIVSLVVVVAEGLLLSVTGSRPLWDSALTPVVFVVEAVITSIAFLYVAISDEKVNQWLASVLRVFLPILLVLTFVEVITVMVGGEANAKEAMRLLLTGNLALLFWGQIAVGIVLPMVIFALKGSGRILTISAAILAILGILVAKLNLLVAGQAYPMFEKPIFYSPSWVEISAVIGVVAFAILLFALGRRVFPSKV